MSIFLRATALSSIAFVSVLLVTTSARAQSSAEPAAEQLFREGHGLLAAGHVVEACQKFDESQRLDPAIGTLLNLAICHERAGRLASAWAEYIDVAALAARAGQRNREAFAREKTSELEPRLSRLAITLSSTNDVVHLDGARLGPATVGTAIPVDSGSHRIEVLRVDGTRWEREVIVEPGATQARIEVPAASEAPPVTSPEPRTAFARGAPANSASSSRRWVAVGVGTVGLVAGGFAAVYAVTSASRARGGDASRSAGDDATARQFDDQASLLRNYAIVSGALAVAGVSTGLIVWFTSPRARDPMKRSVDVFPIAGPTRASIELRAKF